MAKPIASYFATVGMDVDPKAIANVDAFLGKLKQRLDKFQTYSNNQKSLQFVGSLRFRETRTNINTQLAKIGENLTLPIKNVKIVGKDAKAGIQGSLGNTAFNIKVNGKLSRESIEYMKSQLKSAFASTTFDVRSRVSIPNKMPGRGNTANNGSWLSGIGNIFGGGKSRGGGGLGGLSNLTGLLGKGGMGSMGSRLLGLGGLGVSAIGSVADMSMSVLAAPFKAIGSVLDATSNSIMRAGMRAIPLIGGAYGLSQVNKANDEYQSQRMASDAIFSSGDFGVTGKDARDWLMNAAMRDGFSYKDTMPQFNGFMASSMPLMGYEKSRDTFEAFTQFGRTRGSTTESMGRALYALQQMAGKGQIMSEELNGQLAEAQGFSEAKGIFAEAYQRFLAKGGPPKLTGDKAVAALGEAMKKGLVKPSDIFPDVTRIMREKSASGIDAARGLASSEQERFGNQRQLFMQQFSDNGGEAGFKTFWQTMAQGMERIAQIAPQIGNYFKAASEYVSGLFLAMGEIYDFVTTGEMTSVAQWLEDQGFDVKGLREDILTILSDVKTKFTELFGEGSLGDRAKSVVKAVFDTGLIKDYVMYLKQTAELYLSIAQAAKSLFSGNFGDALKHLGNAGKVYADRLGTSIKMGGSTYEVVRAFLEGKDYQTPTEKNYVSDVKEFTENPLGMYERLGATETGGMSFSEWKAHKGGQLDQTARTMAAENNYNFNPTTTGPVAPTAAPWMPAPLGAPSIADMAANPSQTVMTDVAAALQRQQVKHNIDLKLNMSVDVKTDESMLGQKISKAASDEVAVAIQDKLQSMMKNIPNY